MFLPQWKKLCVLSLSNYLYRGGSGNAWSS